MSDIKPEVTVVCITYNHEDYIEQALESFVTQETSFPFQIFVGEDCGNDRTAEIVLEYSKKYPDLVKPFIREKNMGAQRNLIDLCRRAESKYIALCEGDDFWIDVHKLQKQYDYMESHESYRACFHNTKIMADESWYLTSWYNKDENGNILIPYSIPGYDVSLRSMTMDYYILFGPAHTSSIFYRWDNDKVIPEWYYKHIYGDHSLMMIQAGDGVIGFIPDIMSVYRRSEVGVLMHENKTSHFLKTRASWIDMVMDLENYFQEYYDGFAVKEIREREVQEFNNYIRYIINSMDFDLFKNAIIEYSYPAKLSFAENDRMKARLKKLETRYTEDGVKYLLGSKALKKEVEEKLAQKKEKQKQRLEDLVYYNKLFSSSAKEKNVWVFSSDGLKSYTGNTKHLFEYIIAFHPEIEAYYLTKSKNVLKFGIAENLPIIKADTEKAIGIMSRACVAFVNKSKVDSLTVKGMNDGIKVIRLGQSVRVDDFKYDKFYNKLQKSPILDIEELEQYFIENKNFSLIENNAVDFFTEQYDKTFLAITQNEPVASELNSFLKIPEDRILLMPSPSYYAVQDYHDKKHTVLLAPSPRNNYKSRKLYIDLFSNSIEMINERLRSQDIYMDVFMGKGHNPDFKKTIIRLIDLYSNIDLISPQEIYSVWDNYDVLISDFWNPLYEFAKKDKPVVLMNCDKEYFLPSKSWIFNYDEIAPGQQTDNWDEALDMVEQRLKDPSIDSEMRNNSSQIVFDYIDSDEQLEELVNEIKKRIDFDN